MKQISIRRAFLIIAVSIPALIAGCYVPVANTAERGPDPQENAHETASENNMSTSDRSSSNDASKTGDGSDVEGSRNKGTGFRGNLEENLKRHGLNISDIVDEQNPVESRILKEYGAVFLTSARPPSKVMFTSESGVSGFQTDAGIARADLGGTALELQPPAMNALQAARKEASEQGIRITPRDGEEAGRRSFEKTLELWNDRFYKACDHWKAKGKLSADQVSRLKSLPIKQQVAEVLELEKSGIYFNTFFNNSILYSVAAPGTSQHLSMLAFDANEYENVKLRRILSKHGWFRTVQNDAPHFTYLGYKEDELPGLGLRKVVRRDGEFWVPDL